MFSLLANIRNKSDKLDNLRKQGFLPGVLYGEGVKNTLISVNEKDFAKVFKEAGETSMVDLELGGKKFEVLIHQLAKNAVNDKFIHIDFFHPSSKKKMEAEIALVFNGDSEAVKTLGGVLIKGMQELHVRGLAKDLPKEIVVDISVLKNIGDRVAIGDLKLPAGIEVIGHHIEDVVVNAAAPREEKEMKALESTAEGEGEAKAEATTEKEQAKKEEK